jgi:glycosyltransferase involved in cell wall biosynthesis
MSEMEAMACARPVVCDFTYGSWYPQEPPIVQAKTVEEITDRIQNLIDNPSMCKDIGEAGRNWVMDNHDYIAVAKRLAKMYEKKPV